MPDYAVTPERPILSIGLFADPHYAKKVYGGRYCQDSLEKLRVCIETFNARNLSMAINLGDSIDKVEDKDSGLAFLREILKVYAAFRGERHIVLGNHDLETLTKNEFLAQYKNKAFQQPYYSFDKCGIHFVILDGNYNKNESDFGPNNNTWDQAWLSQKQIHWLKTDLKANREKRAIIFCHENIDNCLQLEKPDPHLLQNAADVRVVMEQAGNVNAVIQGHCHYGKFMVVNGIPYIGLKAMVVGPGLDNNAYAIASFYKNGSLAIEGFGRQNSLRVPVS